MYAHTAAHQQAMSSVVVKERKKREKFIRNTQIVGSSRTAAARGVKKLLYLQPSPIHPTHLFPFSPAPKGSRLSRIRQISREKRESETIFL